MYGLILIIVCLDIFVAAVGNTPIAVWHTMR
jgi:hypothetical protein